MRSTTAANLVFRLSGLLVASVIFCGVPARAQTVPAALSGTVSGGSFDSHQEGLYTTAVVVLDGAELFRVATTGRADPTAVTRALIVDSVLQQIVATDPDTGSPGYDAATLNVRVRSGHDQDMIDVVDDRHATPLRILTVTSTDAKYQQTNVDYVAARWQRILQVALVQALRNREPAVERNHAGLIVRLGIALAAGSALLLLVLAYIRRRIVALTRKVVEQDELAEAKSPAETASEPEHAAVRRNALEIALRAIAPRRRLKNLSALAETIVWLLLLTWFIAITWAFHLFPQTAALARALSRGGTTIGIIWFATALLNRALDVAISGIAADWNVRHYPGSLEQRARAMLRVPTISSALTGFKTFTLIAVAALLSLGQLGLQVTSVVTIGGVVALAITFATQNFLRDFVGGLMVLFEDQYAVGDFVTINAYTGLVERLTLRMVQVRDPIGSVVTIAHSTVTTVANHSRDWSRIDFRVTIDPTADPAAAIESIRASVNEFAAQPECRGSVLLPVEWIGVDNFNRDWTLIRASIRTAPLRQYEARRQLNAFVRRRLGEAGIAFGPPIPAEFIPLV